LICPYCHDELDSASALACDSCATPVHGECAAIHGRCVTLGCRGARFVPFEEAGRRLGLPFVWLLRHAAFSIWDDALALLLGLAGLGGLALIARLQ
jgi:hypothetical protein